MYDVYVGKADLLILPKGTPVPRELGSNWRKKRIVRSVSGMIRKDVECFGYHRRDLRLITRATKSRREA